jgi:hypothetical protein
LRRNKIDLLISIFQTSNPKFLKKYTESRIIQKETSIKAEEVKKGKNKEGLK